MILVLINGNYVEANYDSRTIDNINQLLELDYYSEDFIQIAL